MVNYLLDTNIISELTKIKPSEDVMNWLSNQSEISLFLSSITIAEIMRRVSRLEDGKKRNKLMQWVQEEIPNKFYGRILDFDMKCAFLWGKWQGQADKKGRPFSVMDGQIATVASRFGLTLVTRNTKDMIDLPVKVFNPFE